MAPPPVKIQERPGQIRDALNSRWSEATDEGQRVIAVRDAVLAAAKAAATVKDPRARGEVARLLAGWAADGQRVVEALLSIIESQRSPKRGGRRDDTAA